MLLLRQLIRPVFGSRFFLVPSSLNHLALITTVAQNPSTPIPAASCSIRTQHLGFQ